MWLLYSRFTVFDTLVSNIKQFAINLMPANWSQLTICTSQVLVVTHSLGHSNILKVEHVSHQPAFCDEFCLAIFCRLLEDVRQLELEL